MPTAFVALVAVVVLGFACVIVPGWAPVAALLTGALIGGVGVFAVIVVGMDT